MAKKNFFPLSREIMTHWLWKYKPFSKGQSWIDLLLLANFEDKKRPYKGEVITCKRGDVNLSISELSQRWGWSRETARRFLRLLESDGMVTVNATKHRTTITIENYSNFNNSCVTDDTTDVQPASNQCATDVQPVSITKKVKKDKNVKNEEEDIYISADERHIIPPTLEMVTRYCTERNKGVDPQKFIDWYEARGWLVGKTKMKDWQAAVRTWERNDKPKKGTGNPYLDMLGDDYER